MVPALGHTCLEVCARPVCNKSSTDSPLVGGTHFIISWHSCRVSLLPCQLWCPHDCSRATWCRG